MSGRSASSGGRDTFGTLCFHQRCECSPADRSDRRRRREPRDHRPVDGSNRRVGQHAPVGSVTTGQSQDSSGKPDVSAGNGPVPHTPPFQVECPQRVPPGVDTAVPTETEHPREQLAELPRQPNIRVSTHFSKLSNSTGLVSLVGISIFAYLAVLAGATHPPSPLTAVAVETKGWGGFHSRLHSDGKRRFTCGNSKDFRGFRSGVSPTTPVTSVRVCLQRPSSWSWRQVRHVLGPGMRCLGRHSPHSSPMSLTP